MPRPGEEGYEEEFNDDIVIEDIPEGRRNSIHLNADPKGEKDLDEAMKTFNKEKPKVKPAKVNPPKADPPKIEEDEKEVVKEDGKAGPEVEPPKVVEPKAAKEVVPPKAAKEVKPLKAAEEIVPPKIANEVNPPKAGEVKKGDAKLEEPKAGDVIENQPVNPEDRENNRENRRQHNGPVQNKAQEAFMQDALKKKQKPAAGKAAAGKDAAKKEDKKTAAKKGAVQQEKKMDRPYRGTVNAQQELEPTFLQNQSDAIRTLRYLTREVTFGSRRGFSSPEFRKIKQDLYKLDKFMRTMNGRTAMTAQEMEIYEQLTLNVYASTTKYLNKKRADLRSRTDANGKVKTSLYEQKRIIAIRDIQKEIGQLRANMYEKDLKKHQEEMQKNCSRKLGEMKDTYDSLNHAAAKQPELKEVLEEAVGRTMFYMNRMRSLEKGVQMKAGDSFQKTKKRMDRDLEPTKQEMKVIVDHELTQQIVQTGMKEIQAGKPFSVDDVGRLQKEYIQKKGRSLADQRRRQSTLQKAVKQPAAEPEKKAEAQVQKPEKKQVQNPEKKQVQNPERRRANSVRPVKPRQPGI